MIKRLRALSLCGVVACASVLTGCGGLQHTNLTAIAPVKSEGFNPQEAGEPTNLIGRNDTLIIASTKGITMLKSLEKVWFVELPEAQIRKVNFERGQIGWSSYNYDGSGSAGFWSRAIFNASSVPSYSDGKIGIIDCAGAQKWTIDAHVDEQMTAISAPAIGTSSVAVNRGTHLETYSLSDGKYLGSCDVMNAGPVTKLYSKFIRNMPPQAPVSYEGGFYGGSLFTLHQIDQSGKEIKKVNGFGMLHTFGLISAGPVIHEGKLIFASEDQSNSTPPTRVGEITSVSPEKFKRDWGKKYKKDTKSGFGAMTVAGDKVFVATNLHLVAYSTKGKQLWAVGGGQAVYCSDARGVRYGGSWPFGYRVSTGNLLLADEKNVYISSPTKSENEAITVLGVEKGAYVRSMQIDGKLLDMAFTGDKIAAITSKGLVFFER